MRISVFRTLRFQFEWSQVCGGTSHRDSRFASTDVPARGFKPSGDENYRVIHVSENLYLGDRFDAEDRDALRDRSIDHVVSLNHDPFPCTDTHHPLSDGANPQSEFDRAVDIVREQYGEADGVLVHCAAGVSRSVAVVASVLAAEEGLSFREALEAIEEEKPNVSPAPELREQAANYLDEAP